MKFWCQFLRIFNAGLLQSFIRLNLNKFGPGHWPIAVRLRFDIAFTLEMYP